MCAYVASDIVSYMMIKYITIIYNEKDESQINPYSTRTTNPYLNRIAKFNKIFINPSDIDETKKNEEIIKTIQNRLKYFIENEMINVDQLDKIQNIGDLEKYNYNYDQ